MKSKWFLRKNSCREFICIHPHLWKSITAFVTLGGFCQFIWIFPQFFRLSLKSAIIWDHHLILIHHIICITEERTGLCVAIVWFPVRWCFIMYWPWQLSWVKENKFVRIWESQIRKTHHLCCSYGLWFSVKVLLLMQQTEIGATDWCYHCDVYRGASLLWYVRSLLTFYSLSIQGHIMKQTVINSVWTFRN